MSEPTRTIELPARPVGGFRRPALMSALALAEHLVAAPVPAPVNITIESPFTRGEKAIVKVQHLDMPSVFAWQAEFGGEIKHELLHDEQILSALHGRMFDVPFQVWTLRRVVLTPEQQAVEQQQLAKWCNEHGAYDDWAAETRTAYCALVLRYRLAVAR